MNTYLEVGAVGIIVALFVLMIMNLMKSQKSQNEDLDTYPINIEQEVQNKNTNPNTIFFL